MSFTKLITHICVLSFAHCTISYAVDTIIKRINKTERILRNIRCTIKKQEEMLSWQLFITNYTELDNKHIVSILEEYPHTPLMSAE